MKRLTAVAPLVTVLGCVLASSASASPVHVTGTQSAPDKTAGHPGDPCRAVDPLTGLAPALSNTMTGSLIGCWYTDTFNLVQSKPDGEILAIGSEHFLGCLDADHNGGCSRRDPRGTLAFIYAFEGKFDSAGKEIRGQCQHPIVSGTGDFKGARGRIDFTDNVAIGNSAYQGKITLTKRSPRARARALAFATRSSARSIC
jgi:hypothetical protein